jgi:hypothetical protein
MDEWRRNADSCWYKAPKCGVKSKKIQGWLVLPQKQVYANMTKNAPKRGLLWLASKAPFSKRDDMCTPTGQEPPSPCRHCGSGKHWNRACPYHDMHVAQMKATGNSVKAEDTVYEKAYAHSVNRAAMNVYVGVPQALAYILYSYEDIDSYANLPHLVCPDDVADPPCSAMVSTMQVEGVQTGVPAGGEQLASRKTFLSSGDGRPPQVVLGAGRIEDGTPNPKGVEDIPDDRNVDFQVSSGPSDGHILEEIGYSNPMLPEPQPARAANCESRPERSQEDIPLEDTWDTIAEPAGVDAEAKLGIHKPEAFVVAPRHTFEPGHSATGISVLSATGLMGSTSKPLVDLRLDSCTDITLLSQSFYEGMRNQPKLQKGMKLKLWQLTDKSTEISGYILLPVYMRCADGQILCMDAEAYVVPGMIIDVLLGEDFQWTYRILSSRDGDSRPQLEFAGHLFRVNADDVG